MISSPANNVNILIVDDDQFNLIILSEILKTSGYSTQSAMDGFGRSR